MTARRHIGLLLATVLVLGSVVSPVVHYSWMSLGGHFNAPHDVGNHHVHDHGTQITTDDVEHLTCDYSNLFGTFTACASPEPRHATPDARSNQQVSLASLVDAVASVDSIQLRGPPVV